MEKQYNDILSVFLTFLVGCPCDTIIFTCSDCLRSQVSVCFPIPIQEDIKAFKDERKVNP